MPMDPMPAAPPLILASSSPTRRILLGRLGIPFGVCAPEVDETPAAGEKADALAARLAHAKAMRAAMLHPRALIIGADQVAVVGETRLGKPGNAERAASHLRAASGQTVSYYTALCVHNAASAVSHTAVVTDRVTLRHLDDAVIARYLAREQPFDCAGALRSEGLGIALCARMESTDPTALLGLPLIALVEFLAREGLELP